MKCISTLKVGGLKSPLLTLGRGPTLQILFMCAPTNSNDFSGCRKWVKILVLFALKMTEKLGTVETDVGSLCAVETVSMWWVKKYMPDQTPRNGMVLPWTCLVGNRIKTFTFQSNFDTNGVLYAIGTCFGTGEYQNPHTAGDVTVTWSSIGSGSVHKFVQNDDPGGSTYTSCAPNSWMQVDLGNHKLRPTHYCLRHGFDIRHNGHF